MQDSLVDYAIVSGSGRAEGMKTRLSNRFGSRFVELPQDRTRWDFESAFRCEGLLRIMSLVMPGMFKKLR